MEAAEALALTATEGEEPMPTEPTAAKLAEIVARIIEAQGSISLASYPILEHMPPGTEKEVVVRRLTHAQDRLTEAFKMAHECERALQLNSAEQQELT